MPITSLLFQGGNLKNSKRHLCGFGFSGLKLVVLVLLISVLSCTKIIPPINDDEPHQYVLNCFLSPDHPIEVFISRTIPVLAKTNYSWEDEWDIKLYENDVLLPFVPEYADSSYLLYYSVQPGSHYRIEALNRNNNHLLTAEDVVPKRVSITELTELYPLYTDRHDTTFGQLTLRFNDDGNVSNYYEIVVGHGYNQRFKTSHTYKITHPVITHDSEYDLYPLTLLFTNELFRGEELVLDIAKDGYGGAIILKNVSYNYFMYKRYLYAHLENQNRKKDFAEISDPVMLYSNVNNGLGIFASHCQDIKWVDGN
ncbi:protein of unknown function [Alkalitalea saponilacus]|uniref:DUF4249 domain-containing protein n=2 Tax=Alkalitalea saponilacus TaxID=889453 RepID=A0A1T5HT22_9BACT|nr:protein of unknown function [Alkalitalea saponilacus]